MHRAYLKAQTLALHAASAKCCKRCRALRMLNRNANPLRGANSGPPSHGNAPRRRQHSSRVSRTLSVRHFVHFTVRHNAALTGRTPAPAGVRSG